MRMLFVWSVVAAMAGCGGTVADAGPSTSTESVTVYPAVCNASADPTACAQCLNHAPLGIVGSSICETAAGPAGSTCCSVTTTAGCVAMYFDGDHEVTSGCDQDH